VRATNAAWSRSSAPPRTQRHPLELRALRRDPAFSLVIVLALAALSFALANGLSRRRHLDGLRSSAARVDADLAAKSRADAADLEKLYLEAMRD
jgi:hypothetical protein